MLRGRSGFLLRLSQRFWWGHLRKGKPDDFFPHNLSDEKMVFFSEFFLTNLVLKNKSSISSKWFVFTLENWKTAKKGQVGHYTLQQDRGFTVLMGSDNFVYQFNDIIGKKVKVSLRLFDIFQRNVVSIFFLKVWALDLVIALLDITERVYKQIW